MQLRVLRRLLKGPATAYQIRKSFGKAAYSAVLYSLRSLAAEGLIEETGEPRARGAKAYRLTAWLEDGWKSWVLGQMEVEEAAEWVRGSTLQPSEYLPGFAFVVWLSSRQVGQRAVDRLRALTLYGADWRFTGGERLDALSDGWNIVAMGHCVKYGFSPKDLAAVVEVEAEAAKLAVPEVSILDEARKRFEDLSPSEPEYARLALRSREEFAQAIGTIFNVRLKQRSW